MKKDFSKMTNKELEKYCTENNIKVESKNVSKPTKSELLSAISSKEKKVEPVEDIGDVIDQLDNEIDNEGLSDDDLDDFLNTDPVEVVAPKKEQKAKLTRNEKRKKQIRELMPLRRVIITSNDNSQTRIKNQVNYVAWGNRLIGHHTDRFVLDTPWHVHEGALRNLEDMMLTNSIQDEEGNTIRFEKVKAYVIQYLDPLTKEQRELIAKRQTIRDSANEYSV